MAKELPKKVQKNENKNFVYFFQTTCAIFTVRLACVDTVYAWSVLGKNSDSSHVFCKQPEEIDSGTDLDTC